MKKNKEGNKRLRLSQDEIPDTLEIDNLSPLQPILLCLEYALKADAHEGGDWIRGDDGQRYNILLSPISKLLQANVPPYFPLKADYEHANCTSFQKLVQGEGTLESGNVTGCLTALAVAVGNEQLWKPLNHAIVDACGNIGRTEVRKAGIVALFSLLQALREEYMVLLPECLPVLSELLEDKEEEISDLARECIRLGEEFLGESLEDSLR